tara:strand:+ start:1777 stop:1947 length:171 start_codon:yes stop_codon:yes gene_type:complete
MTPRLISAAVCGIACMCGVHGTCDQSLVPEIRIIAILGALIFGMLALEAFKKFLKE